MEDSPKNVVGYEIHSAFDFFMNFIQLFKKILKIMNYEICTKMYAKIHSANPLTGRHFILYISQKHLKHSVEAFVPGLGHIKDKCSAHHSMLLVIKYFRM